MADPGKGPGPPLFSEQTEARKTDFFFETALPPLSKGLDDPPLSQDLDPALHRRDKLKYFTSLLPP